LKEKKIRTKSVKAHFGQKVKNIKKAEFPKAKEHLRLNQFLLVLMKKKSVI